MRRAALAALVLLVLVACGGGAWFAQSRAAAGFVLPGASQLEVTPRGLGAERIMYRAADGNYEWRNSVWQQLTGQGWRGRDYTFGTTRTFAVTWYYRSFHFGPLELLESAVVGGDPHDPQLVIIEVHRELHINR